MISLKSELNCIIISCLHFISEIAGLDNNNNNNNNDGEENDGSGGNDNNNSGDGNGDNNNNNNGDNNNNNDNNGADTSYSWACSFEDDSEAGTFCDITQSVDDDFDWTLTRGRTPSDPTGPERAFSEPFYIYIEVTGLAPDVTAR